VDFLYQDIIDEENDLAIKICVEIDGQETHKTKEQRLKDYRRERFLQASGFHVVRFTASEIFVDADACVQELLAIARTLDKNIDAYIKYGGEIERWYLTKVAGMR
jgi:very-short-patch-repair endonuclease